MAHKTYDRPPEMALDLYKDYHANLVTEKGTVRIRLFAEQAPETVNNFCRPRGSTYGVSRTARRGGGIRSSWGRSIAEGPAILTSVCV
jgi:hypothetical protein